MTFLELAAARYSVRSYKATPVEEEKLAAVLEAGRLAPTAVNYQPQKVYIIRPGEVMQRLNEQCRFTFGAPLVLAVGYDKDRDWKNKRMPGYSSGETDAAIVTTHMMLAAWEQGLGSCWVGAADFDAVHAALGLPENVRLTALLPLGYAADNAVPGPLHAQSRPLEEMVCEL